MLPTKVVILSLSQSSVVRSRRNPCSSCTMESMFRWDNPGGLAGGFMRVVFLGVTNVSGACPSPQGVALFVTRKVVVWVASLGGFTIHLGHVTEFTNFQVID